MLSLYLSLSLCVWASRLRTSPTAPPGDPGVGRRGLNVSGKVECVALELREGNGRMLQVVEKHLDLCHDVM